MKTIEFYEIETTKREWSIKIHDQEKFDSAVKQWFEEGGGSLNFWDIQDDEEDFGCEVIEGSTQYLEMEDNFEEIMMSSGYNMDPDQSEEE